METTLYYQTKLGIVRNAELKDVFELADNLRMDDITEVWRSHHKTPQEALFDSFTGSAVCMTIECNEKPIAMFGVVPHSVMPNVATIWLLASPELEKVQRAFLKHSRYFIDTMLGYYPLLINYIDVQNTVSLKWIKWLGAEFGPIVPYGVEGCSFQYFQFKR